MGWLIGGLILVCGLTWLGLNYPRVNASTEPAEFAPPEEAVACFGHVDVKHGDTSL